MLCQSTAYQDAHKKLISTTWDVIEKPAKTQKWNRELRLSLLAPWWGPVLNANGRNPKEGNRAIVRHMNLENQRGDK